MVAGNTPVLVHNSNGACDVPGAGKKRSRAQDLPRDPKATGDHTVFEMEGSGRVTRYQTWIKNDRNPNGWDKGPRFRGQGKLHKDIRPPLYYPKGGGLGVAAEGEHLPRGY